MSALELKDAAPAAPAGGKEAGGEILTVRGLRKEFVSRRGRARLRAVDGVGFGLGRGEILALVGESGCGKTTTGKLIMRLIEPTSGSISVDGMDTAGLSREDDFAYRRRVQMIFQDPYASMNPHFKVRDVLEEPLLIHGIGGARAQRMKMIELALETVKLTPASEFLDRHPHMLSGGQRQRVATARTLILSPSIIVADEPVSMIDLSTRAEILHLIKSIQRDLGLSIIYITHDISTARYFADRIAVMYLGRIVEIGTQDDVIDRPIHPYTRALIDAVCEPEPGRVDRMLDLKIRGEVPSAADIPPGCRFHPRCLFATEECSRLPEPELEAMGAMDGVPPDGDPAKLEGLRRHQGRCGHLHACRRYAEI